MPSLGILVRKVRKNFCHIWNQFPRICLISKILKKKNRKTFGITNALFWFSRNFWKTTVIFEISSLEFVLLESFVQKIKIPKFGTKNSDFGAGILKYCSHIWNQPPRICLLTMFDPNKKKSLNLGPKTPHLSTFGLEVENYFVIFEISTLEFV